MFSWVNFFFSWIITSKKNISSWIEPREKNVVLHLLIQVKTFFSSVKLLFSCIETRKNCTFPWIEPREKNCVFYLLSQVKKMLPWVNRVEWKHFFSRLKLFFFLMYRTEWKKISLVKLFFRIFRKKYFYI